MKKKTEKIYLGLNVGTNSIGYAVTDEQYHLLKFNGNDAWGSIVFDAASSNEDRRNHRLARRNLDRRQQRIVWLQEIFAKEISKVDDRFLSGCPKVFDGERMSRTDMFSLMIKNIRMFNT